MERVDGGPAFPRPASIYTGDDHLPNTSVPCDSQDGMSIRDWFAGQALSGLLTNQGRPITGDNGEPLSYGHAAYLIADMMLVARNF